MDYDSAGNLVELVDAAKNATAWTYDVLSRPTAEIVKLDTFNSNAVRTGQRQFQRTWQYNGLTTAATDRLGRVTRMIVGPTNLISSTDWLANPTNSTGQFFHLPNVAASGSGDGFPRSGPNDLLNLRTG